MTERTIFEKIWDGEIPSHTIYRNDEHGLLAVLDDFPVTPGHTLVVPREAVDQWIDLSDERLTQVTILGKFVARHMQNVLQPLRVTKHTLGFGVPHIHDQYIPSYERGDTAGLYNPERMKARADFAVLRAMQEALEFPDELAQLANTRMTELATTFQLPSR